MQTFKSSRKWEWSLVLAGFSKMALPSFPLWKEMQINVFPVASLVFLCRDLGIAKHYQGMVVNTQTNKQKTKKPWYWWWAATLSCYPFCFLLRDPPRTFLHTGSQGERSVSRAVVLKGHLESAEKFWCHNRSREVWLCLVGRGQGCCQICYNV